jgi:D-tyrosyl-tRNA(Tyr) deacylase
VDSRTVSSIGQGLLVLLGVMKGDTEKDLMYLVRKIAKLRIFYDDDDKMNLSVLDIGGEVIVVSQFTLASDTRRGNRPSFVEAESPARAQQMYEMFIEQLSAMGIKVGQGEFGAHMSVALVNDGPVTIIMDSK